MRAEREVTTVLVDFLNTSIQPCEIYLRLEYKAILTTAKDWNFH